MLLDVEGGGEADYAGAGLVSRWLGWWVIAGRYPITTMVSGSAMVMVMVMDGLLGVAAK